MRNIKKINLKSKLGWKMGWKEYTIASIALIGVMAGLTIQTLRAVNDWYATHELVFNKVVSLEIKKPIEIKKKEVETKEIVRVINEVPEPEDLITDAEKYIYEVFGIEDYKIAIAIAKAESGLREDAIGINTNGTVDIGIFQINSVHYSKQGCSLKEVSTIKGNVDCAKQIYDASGWNPWVAYKNGNFITKLN